MFLDDPGGGRYAQPKLVPMLGLDPVDPAMAEPGIKVFHVQEVDFRSTCPTLVACLGDIRDWSDDHPDHLPITIQIEAKDDPIDDPGLDFVTPIPWTGPDLAALQDEIATVFGPDRVVTPGDVRAQAVSLRAALRRRGWPRLGDMQGQVLFMLDDHGALRDAYRAQFPDLGDRTMFVDVPDTDPDAGIMVVNDPIGDAAKIGRLLPRGLRGAHPRGRRHGPGPQRRHHACATPPWPAGPSSSRPTTSSPTRRSGRATWSTCRATSRPAATP